jgi:hypothetical protein
MHTVKIYSSVVINHTKPQGKTLLFRTWTSYSEEMGSSALDFFESLYTKEENINPSIISDCLHDCVDEDMNENCVHH